MQNSTTHELFRKLSSVYRTPRQVQDLIRSFEYNVEDKAITVKSALNTWEKRNAHCLEAAFVAAAILEHRGYPPLVLSLESQDNIDHVLFLFQEKDGWGSIGRSREEGLHGRAPKFRSVRDLAWSYVDAYVDDTGRVTGYAVANLDDSRARWRDSRKNVWKAEQYLIDFPHKNLLTSEERYEKTRARYLAVGELPRRPEWW